MKTWIPLLSILSTLAAANPCRDPFLLEVQNHRPRTMSNRQFARYQRLVAECEVSRLHPHEDSLPSPLASPNMPADSLPVATPDSGLKPNTTLESEGADPVLPQDKSPWLQGSESPTLALADTQPVVATPPRSKRPRRSALPWVALGIGGTGTLLTTVVYSSITDECDGITDLFQTEEACRENAREDREAILPFLLGFVGLALVGLVSVIGGSRPN